jgi:glycosyltransferase involved in cell wall biosynthesis
MAAPLVSIVVPVYNQASFLKERFQSIFDQTFTDYEVIILDDKSPDNSWEILQEYAHHEKVSHIIENEENSGSPFIQWQKGISLAKGEIIWIAEGDDYCDKTMLEKLVKAYKKYHCVMAFARSVAVDINGKPMYVCQRMFKKDIHAKGVRFIKRYMNVGNRVYNASSAIFSKQAALSVDKSYMNYKECGDWVFWIEIMLQGEVAVISNVLNYFRRNDNTSTSKASKVGTTDIEDFRVLSFLKQRGVYSPYRAFIKRKRMAKRLLYDYNRFVNESVRQEVIEYCDIPTPYYWLARLSHIFHMIKK